MNTIISGFWVPKCAHINAFFFPHSTGFFQFIPKFSSFVFILFRSVSQFSKNLPPLERSNLYSECCAAPLKTRGGSEFLGLELSSSHWCMMRENTRITWRSMTLKPIICNWTEQQSQISREKKNCCNFVSFAFFVPRI